MHFRDFGTWRRFRRRATLFFVALLAFTHDGPGRKFFEASGYGDMGPITDADMTRLRPFLKNLKERLP
jgi:hypothetical protein